MFKIVRKKELNASVTLMDIEAPFIAKKAKAGQFIIFRIDEQGERVPLTIAGYDREKGTQYFETFREYILNEPISFSQAMSPFLSDANFTWQAGAATLLPRSASTLVTPLRRA